jgi:signal peptide peptidase SppA
MVDPDDAARGGEIVDYVGGIAVIQAFGSLVRRKNALQAYSGLTSYADIAQAFDQAVADNNVKAVLLRLDSFGGEAGGCFELCERIYAARKVKPVWAVADIYALSGAYAIGCSAERLYVAPSGQVGSIGVVAVHCETSRANDAAGVTYTVFRAGARKADLNPLEPLATEASARLQASMDRNRDKFAAMVSRNRRGLTKSAVLGTEGAWYDADEAVGLKLVDGVMVFEDVLSQLFNKISGPASSLEGAAVAPGSDPDDTGYDGDEQPVDPAVAAYNQAFAEAQREVVEVAELCNAAGRPELMLDFLDRRLTPAQAKAELAAISWDSAIERQQARTNAPLRTR